MTIYAIITADTATPEVLWRGEADTPARAAGAGLGVEFVFGLGMGGRQSMAPGRVEVWQSEAESVAEIRANGVFCGFYRAA